MKHEDAELLLRKVADVFEMWLHRHSGEPRLEELAGAIMLGLRGSRSESDPDKLLKWIEEYKNRLPGWAG